MVLKPTIAQEESHSVTNRIASLTVRERHGTLARIIEVGRLIARVAVEFHIARATLSKWVSRYRAEEVAGLEHRASAPAKCPSRLPVAGVELIEH